MGAAVTWVQHHAEVEANRCGSHGSMEVIGGAKVTWVRRLMGMAVIWTQQLMGVPVTWAQHQTDVTVNEHSTHVDRSGSHMNVIVTWAH